MMVDGECPNCGEYTNDSTSRLVRDTCGHRKCRMCLVYEEDGCKTCRSKPRIQTIGNFDYPVPSSPLVSVSIDSSGSNTGSEKEDVISQPLELVTHKTLDHNRGLFNHQESYGSENSACRSEWSDNRNLSVRINISECPSANGKTAQNLNQNNRMAEMQRHVTIDTDFDVKKQNLELQKSLLPQTHVPKMEPLELVTNIRASLENDANKRQNALIQSMNLCEKNRAHTGDEDAKEKAQKPKRRQNGKIQRNHIAVIPGIQETYRCNICNKTFKSPTAQRYHDSCVTGIKPYKCTTCDRSFVKQSHYQYHERTHTGYKPFECSFCGKAFPQRNKLNRHLHSHQNEKRFKCSVCEKGYCSREDLRSHMNIHTGAMPYTCQVCKKSFREAANLTRHMHTHSDVRPHMCEQCGKSFKDKSLLVRHRRTHGKDRPFSCSDCSRVFLSKSELSRHLAVHSDDKPFPCPFCNTVFRRKDNLNRHTRHHHSDDQTTANDEKSKCDDDDTQPLKSRPANISKAKTKAKEKAKSVSSSLPKSPARVSGIYSNSHEQTNSRLDSRSNVIPVIRTTNELSNAVPVINGPISIKRPEETVCSPKKAFTHTEPIPLAQALNINRRIEEKLYPKSNTNNDCYFRNDFRNRQNSVNKIKTVRNNVSNKNNTAAGKIYSPERSFLEPRGSPAPVNRTDKFSKTQLTSTRKYLTSEDGIGSSEVVKNWNDCQESGKGMNTPKHTVPKKRAIEELKSKPMGAERLEFGLVGMQEGQSGCGVFEPERANCVPTITKAGNANASNESKGYNMGSCRVISDNGISDESRIRSDLNMEKCTNVKKDNDIHWRRRTSEILKPRIQGFNSSINCQSSELEMTDVTNSKG